MEDIRANNGIPAKSLTQLLWERYGVNMYQNTTYRMSRIALQEIQVVSMFHIAIYQGNCEVVKAINPGSPIYLCMEPKRPS